jgi:Domain of unknown function (DUF4355)
MEDNKVIEGQENPEQGETKTYSEEEVQQLIQSETDRKVTKALDTAKSKWQEEYEAKLQHEKSEAEKLAKLSESERMQLEFDKQKQDFEEQRKQFMREKLELQTIKELSAIGLPTDFSKFVIADTADEIQSNIADFKQEWEAAIEKAVNEKLQGTTPKTATKQGAAVTKEQFKKMNYQEKMAIYADDPELYEQLKG